MMTTITEAKIEIILIAYAFVEFASYSSSSRLSLATVSE